MGTFEVPISAIVDRNHAVHTAAQRLRNTLRLNAATSMIGGVVAVAVAGPLSRLFETSSASQLRIVGSGLIAFAVGTATLAGCRVQQLARFTPAVIVSDASWALASVATIAMGWYSTGGDLLIGAVAVMVTAFALRQRTTHADLICA